MNKRQLHIVALLGGLCGSSSLFGMGNAQGLLNLLKNPAFTNTMRAMGRAAGDVVDGARRAGQDAFERNQRMHQNRIRDLQAIVNDNTRTPGEKQAAREELNKIAQAQYRSQINHEEMQQEVNREFLKVGSATAQGVIAESLAQFAHDREMQKVNLQAKQAGKAAVEQTKE